MMTKADILKVLEANNGLCMDNEERTLMMTKADILKVLEANNGLCMDNEEEREYLAVALALAMKPNDPERREARITIEGVDLDFAQSATIRVAVASWLSELADPTAMRILGAIGPMYKKSLGQIQNMIMKGVR